MKRYTIFIRDYEGNTHRKILTNIVHMPLLCDELRKHYKTSEFTIIDVENVKDNDSVLSKLNRFFIKYEDENETTYF